MHITKRISVICEYLAGGRLADIGTDHCFLPIHAIKSGKVYSAIAADVNEQPLNKARENVAREGLCEQIELRLGDGFAPIAPGECDCAVISGMGGMLIANIIQSGYPVASALKQLILSPQSDLSHVRRTIHKLNFEIYAEDMVKDGGKFYPLIMARPAAASAIIPYSSFEYEFGKLMLDKPSDVFFEFLEELRSKNESIISRNPLMGNRKDEILEANKFIEGVLKLRDTQEESCCL